MSDCTFSFQVKGKSSETLKIIAERMTLNYTSLLVSNRYLNVGALLLVSKRESSTYKSPSYFEPCFLH